MSEYLYNYRAMVVSAYDGDTMTLDIDLGLGVWMNEQKVRLYGIDAPEIRGAEREDGLVSKAKLLELAPVGSDVIISTVKDMTGKYGRWLAVVWANGINVNIELIKLGLAEENYYGNEIKKLAEFSC